MSLYVYTMSVTQGGEWGWRGSREDVNVSLRWQQQHSRTQTCVWHEEGGESISYPTIPASSFSCCTVQTLEPALNFCRQAPGGKWATFAVAVPPGLAGESLSFSNMLTPLSSFCSSSFFLPPLPLSSLFSPPSCFMTVYAKWRFLLSSPTCGLPKQINKSMRTHTFIHKQSVLTPQAHNKMRDGEKM